jgi:probable phosphoglycerate mutase
VLVRHGETEWSKAMKHTGRTDVPLTETGQKQARALRPRLAGRSFELVLTSPLGRAVETCRLAGLGEVAETCPDLIEWDYGEYDGLTTEEVRAVRPDWLLWRDGCPGGERAADVGARVESVIERLRGVDGDVAVFAHGHVLRVLTARWLRLAPEAGAMFALSTATLSVVGYEHEWPAIWVWNASI